MGELLDILQETWAVRALIASSLVGLMCGVLGCFIVLRNMSLVGDALAHAILPGVVGAYLVVGYSALGFFTGSVLAGLITAVGITWIQHRVQTKNDAAIGIVFTAMFSIGVMGISYISRNQGVHLDLKDFLFGNVLGVADTDLILTALVTIYVLLSVVVFFRYLFVTTFQPVIAQTMGISTRLIHYFLMLLLSFAVVAALQTVGVILVVAMLITPAATALLLSSKLQRVLVLAAGIGLLAAVSGFILAVLLETTPGPAMAVTATLLYLIAVIFSPQKGLLAKAWRKQKLHWRIGQEDILKALYRVYLDKQAPKQDVIQERLSINSITWRQQLSRLRQRGLLQVNTLDLTDQGKTAAEKLVRAHRLWETYLADRVGLSKLQIHEDAEKYEHLLTEEMLDAVDETLGFPSVDPHGSPIPRRIGLPLFSLGQLRAGQIASLAPNQLNEQITAFLWRKQLVAGMPLQVIGSEENTLLLQVDDQQIRVPASIARQINVIPTEETSS